MLVCVLFFFFFYFIWSNFIILIRFVSLIKQLKTSLFVFILSLVLTSISSLHSIEFSVTLHRWPLFISLLSFFLFYHFVYFIEMVFYSFYLIPAYNRYFAAFFHRRSCSCQLYDFLAVFFFFFVLFASFK